MGIHKEKIPIGPLRSRDGIGLRDWSNREQNQNGDIMGAETSPLYQHISPIS